MLGTSQGNIVRQGLKRTYFLKNPAIRVLLITRYQKLVIDKSKKQSKIKMQY